MIEVKLYEVFQEEERAIKRHLDPEIKAQFTWRTVQEEGDNDAPAKVISIRTQSNIPLSWATQLEGVLSRSQGYDHLLTYQEKTQAPLEMGYLKEYCSRAVAEHAIMALLVLLKKTKTQLRNFLSFKRDGLTGNNASGRTALVIGVGKIGYHLVDMVRGLKMVVNGVDIEPRHADVNYVSLEEGLKESDVVFCSLPLTKETQGLLNHKILGKIKPHAVFINVSRGEISPIKDLHALILKGVLSGLALDVYEEEKAVADYLRSEKNKASEPHIQEKIRILMDLEQREDVLLTPHNAFNTREALEQKAILTARSIEQFLASGTFLSPIVK